MLSCSEWTRTVFRFLTGFLFLGVATGGYSQGGGPPGGIVIDLAVDPATTSTLYAGAVVAGGVFKSVEGGINLLPTGTSFGNGAPPATAIRKVSGDNQTGNAGQPLTYPFVVVVTNASGIPV